jgi:hypothetical protein
MPIIDPTDPLSWPTDGRDYSRSAPMSLETARDIVGRANSCEPYLSNMIRALSIHSWLNTQEEAQRLSAAKIVKAAKRKGRR